MATTTGGRKRRRAGVRSAEKPASPAVLYETRFGKAVVGLAEDYLPELESDSVDLVITSPPFALLRQKSYGNFEQKEYVDWLVSYGPVVRRVLKDSGSFVLDLGGAYQRGRPIRSLYNYRVLLRMCDEHGFRLAEEFFWHNPAKLPSPIEWVNKRKLRAKDSVNTVWWFSKTDSPKADVRNVLAPYSDRMKKLIEDPDGFYRPKERPSGHDISRGFSKDNGGAIPSNLLQYPNTESNSLYIRLCKQMGVTPHPARFPRALPEFFIRFLTDPGDLVVDFFGGSNTTGDAAEVLGRRWLVIERDREFVVGSAFRFMADWSEESIRNFIDTAATHSNVPLPVLSNQGVLF
jgi:DNA modification methylase